MDTITKEVIQDVIRMALTYANNVCVRESDEMNADDKIEGADAANRCAESIRKAIGKDWFFEEVMLSVGAGSQQSATILTKEVYDKIWEAAIMYQKYNPLVDDWAHTKESFAKSLNIQGYE